MAERRITLGPCGDLAEIPTIDVQRADTADGPKVEIAMLSTDYCWRVRSWWQPEQARRIAERILAAVDAGVAAGPQATPDQDEVLWHTVTTAPGSALGDGMSWLEVSGVMVPVPPGTRVRVVAVPTDHEDRTDG